MASSLEKDSDEEYLDDPIELVDYEQKRINLINRTLVAESIELSDSDVDIITVPPNRQSKTVEPGKKSPKVAYKIVSSSLPVKFFKNSRNIELLKKCLPLHVKVVDCDKFSWYYRKKYKNIKFEDIVIDVDEIEDVNNTFVTISNIKKYANLFNDSVDKDIMKLKIRPVEVESYLKSPIHDIKSALWRQNNIYKTASKNISAEKKIQRQCIDFKKNQGLVGLKIVYDVKKVDSTSKVEGEKQINVAEVYKVDLHTREHKLNENKIHELQQKDAKANGVEKNRKSQSIATCRLLEKHRKKQGTLESPALVESIKSANTNKTKKNFQKTTSSAVEEKRDDERRYENSLSQNSIAPKKDKMKKKCYNQKTKTKSLENKHKVLRESTEAKTIEPDQNERDNVKEIDNITVQKKGLKDIIHYEKDKMKHGNVKKMVDNTTEKKECYSIHHKQDEIMKIVCKNKIILGRSMDIMGTISKSHAGMEINAAENVPVQTNTSRNKAKYSDKDKHGKHKIIAPLQQNIDNLKVFARPGHQINTGFYDISTYNDQMPKSVARVPRVIDRENMHTKLQLPPNIEVASDSRLDNQNHFPTSRIVRPQNEKTFVIRDINDSKIANYDLNFQMPEGLKNIDQSNPKQLLCSDLTVNKSDNTKSYLNNKSVVCLNETNTDNQMVYKRSDVSSQKLITLNVANNQSNDTFGKHRELKQNHGLPIQNITTGPEHQKNKQSPAPNNQHTIKPVSNNKVSVENNQTTTNQRALGKWVISKEKLLTSNFGLSNYNLQVPNSNPSQMRYEIVFPNVPLTKEQRILSQTVDNIPLVASAQPPNTKTPPNILKPIILKQHSLEQMPNPGQHLAVKRYGMPNTNLNLIPSLMPAEKSGYVILNRKAMVNQHFTPKQHTNSAQNNCLPNPQNKVIPNQTTSQHPAPGILPHKNYLTPLHQQQSNSYQCGQFSKQDSTQQANMNKNLQLKQDNLAQNHNMFQASLPNLPPNVNHNMPFYANSTQLSTDKALVNHQIKPNEYAPYYNNNTQLNTIQLSPSNKQPKQNEHGSHYQDNTMLNTEQVPPPTQQPKLNEYGSPFYNQGTLRDTKPKSNEHRPCSNQSTILNLDTNSLVHPRPLHDFVPQNMNDMDCAYWNGVNYLGDEWQQGYPQPPPPVSEHPQPPPVSEHPQPSTVSQHPQPPPLTQHLQPPPISQHSQRPPVFQHPQPPPVSEHPQPSTVSQHPQPPPLTQHLKPPPISQHSQRTPVFQHPQPPPVSEHPQPSTVSQHPQPPPLTQHLQPPPISQHSQRPPVFQHPQPPPVSEHPQPSTVSQHPQPPPFTQHLQPPPISQHSQRPPVFQHPQPPPVSEHPQPSTVSQHLQPPPLTQHLQPPPISQHSQRPPVFQHPQLPPVSQYPQPPSVSQHLQPPPVYNHPALISQHPLPPSPINYLPPPTVINYPPTPIAINYPPPTLFPQQTLPPVSQHLPLPKVIHYPLPTPVPQRPPPKVPLHPPPPVRSPHPSTSLPTTQGTIVLGANSNGVVRTINLVTSTTTGCVTTSNVSTFNKSLDDNDNTPVNTKSEMLQELSKTIDVNSPLLKRPLNDFHPVLKTVKNKPKSGPLAKVRKMEGVVSEPSSNQNVLNKGYSPPILPIPTYETTYKYIAQVSGSMDIASDNIKNAIVDKYKSYKLEGILKNKTDLNVCVDRNRRENPVRRISIDEYKNRVGRQEEKLEDIVVKTEIKTESKFDDYYTDTDLGYDSDSTVKL